MKVESPKELGVEAFFNGGYKMVRVKTNWQFKNPNQWATKLCM